MLEYSSPLCYILPAEDENELIRIVRTGITHEYSNNSLYLFPDKKTLMSDTQATLIIIASLGVAIFVVWKLWHEKK